MKIIKRDTVWKAGETIKLTDDVQVADNATLTIEAGAHIIGNGKKITAYGSVIANGSSESQVVFQGVKFDFGGSTQTARIKIDHALIDGGSTLPRNGGNINISNSTIHIQTGERLTLQGSYGESVFYNNMVYGTSAISVGGSIEIRHNVFDSGYFFKIDVPYSAGTKAPVSRDNIYLGYNGEINIRLGSDGALTSINDYFGVSNARALNKAIIDRNDTLEIKNYVDVKSPVFELPRWFPDIIKTYTSINLFGMTTKNAQLLGTDHLELWGNDQNNKLIGNIGNNYFWGRGGEDEYTGGKGNDFFMVNSRGDKVFERSGEGTDTILTNTSYYLQKGQEIEKIYIGTKADYEYFYSPMDAPKDNASINISGNEFNQIMIGGNGNNIIDGKGGADTMEGLAGNDTYYVDHKGDRVVEAVGGGKDTIVSTVSYALAAGQEVETLQFAKSVGTAALNLTGNEFANTLVGSAGDNVLNGGGGADAMYGGTGNDTYVVDHANDKVSEARGAGTDTVLASVGYALKAGQEIESLRLTGTAGSVNLTGNEFGQSLTGNVGANVLDGGLGADVLTGGKGADTFVFSTKLGAGNVDRITDFTGADTIRLAKSIFSALAPGELKAEEFKDIAKAKVDADDHILYDSRDGSLSYDADGSGKAAAVKFAVLDNKAAITHADFFVV